MSRSPLCRERAEDSSEPKMAIMRSRSRTARSGRPVYRLAYRPKVALIFTIISWVRFTTVLLRTQ